MDKEPKESTFETPKVEYIPVEPVHTAKSWNPGKGRDTTGTGNSGHGGNQGNHGGNNHGGGHGRH